MDERKRLQERIRELTGWMTVGRTAIITDTSDPMAVQRGDIVRLRDRDYLIKGNRYETRFGIGDQPKYWVFSSVDLETGKPLILKTVFYEEFHVHVGVFRMHCYRDPEKESRVLDLTRGDRRFMQGETVYDSLGNNVRILEYIHGDSLFKSIHDFSKPHCDYFEQDLGPILHKLAGCIEAIAHLHQLGFCHGDIRNDHILIERDTGEYRWIDFDLNQHVSDFDVWSLGNVINYVVGNGITSFHEVLRGNRFPDNVKQSLSPKDASAFYEYRVMTLGKLYPYLPQRLQDILAHFTIRPQAAYGSVAELLEDYYEMLDKDFAAG
jgi:serine/threonine protein kinase